MDEADKAEFRRKHSLSDIQTHPEDKEKERKEHIERKKENFHQKVIKHMESQRTDIPPYELSLERTSNETKTERGRTSSVVKDDGKDESFSSYHSVISNSDAKKPVRLKYNSEEVVGVR